MDEFEDNKSVDDDEVSPAPGPSVSGSQEIKIHSPIAKYVIRFIGISGLFMACHLASSPRRFAFRTIASRMFPWLGRCGASREDL